MTTTTPPPPSQGFKMTLQDLLWEYEAAQAVYRLVVMAKIRDYLRRQETMTVVDEVKRITDKKHLRALLGAGAPGIIYHAVVARIAFLEGVT